MPSTRPSSALVGRAASPGSAEREGCRPRLSSPGSRPELAAHGLQAADATRRGRSGAVCFRSARPRPSREAGEEAPAIRLRQLRPMVGDRDWDPIDRVVDANGHFHTASRPPYFTACPAAPPQTLVQLIGHASQRQHARLNPSAQGRAGRVLEASQVAAGHVAPSRSPRLGAQHPRLEASDGQSWRTNRVKRPTARPRSPSGDPSRRPLWSSGAAPRRRGCWSAASAGCD